MKHKVKATSAVSLVSGLALSLILSICLLPVADAQVQTKLNSQNSAADRKAIGAFEDRVKDYLKLRTQVKDQLPKLSKDSTPEQIESYRKSFEEGMRTARAGAKRGDVFNTTGSEYIRRTLKTEFDRKEKAELRKIIFEAENKDVPLRVNYPYPESKELTEMPPTLLLKLPQLPKEVKYRFVGRNLLLVDRDNNVIIDYMVDALP
jgi:hypothetical protein